MDLLIAFIGGLLQGILEWIPVSSEGFLFILFSTKQTLTQSLKLAIALHLSTGIAGLIYFRKTYSDILVDLFKGRRNPLFKYVFYTSIATAATALPLYILYKNFLLEVEKITELVSTVALVLVGAAMIIAGFLSKKTLNIGGSKLLEDLNLRDYILIGAIQGLSIIPGITRSGVTIAALFWRNVKKDDVVWGAFLLAPIVSIGIFFIEILLGEFKPSELFTTWFIIASIASIAVSLIVMNTLIEIGKKIEHWKLLIFIGTLMLTLELIILLNLITS